MALDHIPGTPLAVVRSGGSARTVAIRRDRDGWAVELCGERVVFQVLDEHARRARDLASGRQAREVAGVVRAPMPGLVLRVEVTPGDTVGKGAGLVVLEAMKMENEIRAPGTGVVRSVLVRPGQVVEKGAPLVELMAPG